jgi:hypothetical protein
MPSIGRGAQKQLRVSVPKKTKGKIAVVVPHASRGIEYSGARKSIQKMINVAIDDGYECFICDPASASVARNRNLGALKAKERGIRWMLMADDDMIFPSDTIVRLIAAKKDIVSGLCTARSHPFIITAYKKLDNNRYRTLEYEELNQDGLTEVDGVGGACVLVGVNVLNKIPPPWFAMPPSWATPLLHNLQYRLAGNQSLDDVFKTNKVELPTEFSMTDAGTDGEDLYFSGLVKKFGFKIFVDSGCVVGHIGDWIFSIKDHLEFKGKNDSERHNQASPVVADNSGNTA